MPTYFYKGKGPGGKVRSGTVLAENQRAAVRVLEDMNVFPMEINVRSEGEESGLSVRLRIRADQITLFARQLGDLLRVGVPITRAFETLLRETPREEFRLLLSEISAQVTGGKSLGEALGRYPRLFPELFVSMVRAGEEGGFLAEVLGKIAEHRERQKELKGRVRAALIYPTLLTVFGTATVIYLMVFFIPRFTIIFQDLGGSLPGPTRLLIAISGILADLWAPLLVASIIGGVLTVRFHRTDRGREFFDRLALRIPGLAAVIEKSALARFANTLGTLLASGVPILASLEISRGATGSRVYGGEIAEAARRVKEGAGLAEALEPAPSIPPTFREKIAIGEESGRLSEVLVDIGIGYEKDVDGAVKLFIAIFEPALIFLMAGVVGFIVISMLLPIFSLNQMIQ